MRPTKSEPKLKYSVNKYPNFFSEKKWDDPMYMDNRNAESSELINAISSYASMTIQPRAKLSLSLHEKVGVVLADSRKIGMIEKVENTSTRKSLAKISYVSTLPPIKTEVQQTEEYLRKIKNELNDISLQSIKTSKEVSNLQASINQTKEKSRVLLQILGRTGEKELKQISDRKQITEELKYSHDVRLNMHENLKLDLQVLAKCKRVMQQRLKTLKIELGSLTTQLNNSMAHLNNNIYTKRQYKSKQELTSEEIMARSQIAQNKLTHERNAERIHHKIEGIQAYGEDQFRHETNLHNHFSTLRQLRVQQVLNKFLNSLFHKYQLHWQQYEKCYGLMKMYSNLNRKSQTVKGNIKTESTIPNRMVKNVSINSNSSSKQLNGDGEGDLYSTYNNTFTYKSQLQALISDKQKVVTQLEQIKEKLYSVWASKTFEDSLTQGAKIPSKKVDFTKEIKALLEQEKRAQKNRFVEQQIEMWLTRQEEKLNFSFSKKMSKSDKINKILEYLKSQCSNNFKSAEMKVKNKQQTIAKPANNKNKK